MPDLPDLLERFFSALVHGANSISRPVAFSLHLCFGLTYAAHLYLHRHVIPRDSWARSLLFFPLRGGHRHAVFQVFAWALWGLSAAISLPIYLSLLAASTNADHGVDDTSSTATRSATSSPNIFSSFQSTLLRLLRLHQPLIPLSHVDAASGAAAVSSLWGELFLLKALLVFDSSRSGSGRRRSKAVVVSERGQKLFVGGAGKPLLGDGRRQQGAEEDEADAALQYEQQQQQLLAPRLASLLVCLMGMALSVTGFVLLLALENMPDTASRVLYCCLALSCVFIGASSTHGLGGHLRYCAGSAADSAGAALGVLRRTPPDTPRRRSTDPTTASTDSHPPPSTGSIASAPAALTPSTITPTAGCAAGGGGAPSGGPRTAPSQDPPARALTGAPGDAMARGTPGPQPPAPTLSERPAAGGGAEGGAGVGAGGRGQREDGEAAASGEFAPGPVPSTATTAATAAAGVDAAAIGGVGGDASSRAAAPVYDTGGVAAAAATSPPPGGTRTGSSFSSSETEADGEGWCIGGTLQAHLRAAGQAAAAGGGGGVGEGGGEEDPDADPGEGPTWRFFQPFQGGSVFVATQAIGWTLFSSTVVAVLLLAKQLVAGVGYCLRCWALAAGALMMATQLTLGVSLLTFQHRRRARKLLQPVLRHPGAAMARAAGLVMPVVMMYLPLHVFCSAVAAVFALLPPGRAVGAVVAVLLPYFAVTLRGHPAHTGCRRWGWLCRWFSREVEGSLAWWAGRLEVVRDFDGSAHDLMDEYYYREQQQATAAEVEPPPAAGTAAVAAVAPPPLPPPSSSRRRYVLGFHPHGLYPTGAGFLPLMPSLLAAFPGTTLVTLTASIVHYLPGLRDIAGWAGFRQVTRATFRRALHDTGAVLLCPGGQAELVYADRAFPPRARGQGQGTAPRHPPHPGVEPGRSGAVDAAAAAATAAGAASGQPASGPDSARAWAVSQPPSDMATQLTEQPPQQQALTAPSAPAALPLLRVPTPRPAPPQQQLVIFGGHQGFVRLALEEGAWLVPVLALGETLQLRNLISAPDIQRATYKRLGFPLPFILAGRWGLTTLPLRNPLIYVLGRPLRPPAGWEDERARQLAAVAAAAAAGGHPEDITRSPHHHHGGGGSGAGLLGLRRRRHHPHTRHQPQHSQQSPPQPHPHPHPHPHQPNAAWGSGAPGSGVVVPQAVVDEYHAAFYAALADLWRRHHHRHPVLQHAELVFEWGHHAPPPPPGVAEAAGGPEPPGSESEPEAEPGAGSEAAPATAATVAATTT